MKPLASQWAEFEQRVLPVNVTDRQRHLMKVAFHGGAIAMLVLVERVVRSSESDAEGAKGIAALGKECAQFVEGLTGGKV